MAVEDEGLLKVSLLLVNQGLESRALKDSRHSFKPLTSNNVPNSCPYLELFLSIFFRIPTEYGEIRNISPYSVWMWENTDEINSEFGHFLRSAYSIKESIRKILLCKNFKKTYKHRMSLSVNMIVTGVHRVIYDVSKQVQQDSNPQSCSSKTKSQPYSESGLIFKSDWTMLWELIRMVHRLYVSVMSSHVHLEWLIWRYRACFCYVTYAFRVINLKISRLFRARSFWNSANYIVWWYNDKSLQSDNAFKLF